MFEGFSQHRAGLPRAVRQRQDERAGRGCPHKLRDQSRGLVVAQVHVVEDEHAAAPRRPAPQHAPHPGIRLPGDRGIRRLQGIHHFGDDLAGSCRTARGMGSRHPCPCHAGPLGEQTQQGGLSDPRLSSDLQDHSPAVGQPLDDRGKALDLRLSADERGAVPMGLILGRQVALPLPMDEHPKRPPVNGQFGY